MRALVLLLTTGWLMMGGMSGTVTAEPQGTVAPAAAAAQPADLAAPQQWADIGWPREIVHGDVTLLVYQPQMDKWEGNRVDARAALAIKPAGAPEPTQFGVIWMFARTEVDKVNREVTLDSLQVTRVDFPSDKGKADEYLELLRARVADKTWVLSLDRAEAALAALETGRPVEGHEVKNDPPRIFYSKVPALLVLVDDDPVLQPMADTKLQRVINTRVLIVFDAKAKKYYLHLMEGWLEAPDLNAGWTVTKKVSGDLKKAAKAARESKQIDMLDGPPVSAGQREEADPRGSRQERHGARDLPRLRSGRADPDPGRSPGGGHPRHGPALGDQHRQQPVR